MAASTCMQTIFGSSVQTTRNVGLNQILFASRSDVVSLKGNSKFQIRKFQIRSMSQESETEKVQEQAAIPPPTSTLPPRPISPPKPKVSTSFFDVLAFTGPAPERINGRLAMIGFVAAMGVELASGEDLFAQLQSGGFPLFLGATGLLTAASLIPMFKGVTVESKSGNVMSSNAELWNGRFAMMGLVALAFTEFVKGGALV